MTLYALASVQPTVSDPERLWVAPSACVIGQVHLGLDVGIWFGAVLRGDNGPITVGNRTNVQEGAMLHTDPGFPMTIGEDVTVGHHAILHGCSIGAGTLVGMGATVLNGARIGRNCLIGANALISEGKEFPDNSLIVGMPAKLIRTLDSVDMLYRSAHDYVEKAYRFRQELRPV